MKAITHVNEFYELFPQIELFPNIGRLHVRALLKFNFKGNENLAMEGLENVMGVVSKPTIPGNLQ